jgi:hypothetical protein
MKIKAEILVSLIVLVVIGFVIGIFLSVYSPGTSSHLAEESSSTGKDVQTGAIQTPNFTITVPSGQNICEGCHLSGKKFIPQAYNVKQHAEGGAYCLDCHKIDHDIHPINNNVTCERCHGTKAPQVPVFRNGTIACAECHDYPDPMKPSNGNLVVIHRPRGVDCTRCHTDSCLKCHNEIKNDTKWEKRLGHFKALLGTVQ